MHQDIEWDDRHVLKRCQQRGVAKRDFMILLEAADRMVPVGGGRVSLTLSRIGVAGMRAEGADCTSLDQIARRAIVIDAVGTPITILISFGKDRRRYRRGLISRRRIRRRRG